MNTRRISRRPRPRTTILRIEQLEERFVLSTGIGVYAPSTDTFTLRHTPNAGPADAGTFQFAAPGALPVIGDWNGDGRDDFGIFDAATATWSLRYGAEAGPANAGVFQFGQPGSVPVVGDWNGDGRDDIGTFLPSTATWTLRYGASPGLPTAGVFQFGATSQRPIVGDWDGDGIDGIGTFTKSTSTWTLRQTASAGAADAGTFKFGPSGASSIAVAGDWNNDGRDGIGVFQTNIAQWTLRQTASSGGANAGSFRFGPRNTIPVVGDFDAPAAPEDAVTTLVLPPVNIGLLGLEVRTSPITVNISSTQGDGKLLGNLLTTVTTLIDLDSASQALNTILDSTVDLLNSADLNITGLGQGPLDTAQASATQVLELFVAPVHLDLLGVQVDTSTIRVTITTKSGQGLVLGNAVTELINLFNPPLPEELDIDFLNSKLDELLAKLEQQLPGIGPAETPPVPVSEG
ncbi:MAG TPA: VCBS repeat-containing protein [Lacipirellulaceae bacterium]|nr:VCBS repeat-containing protein [Lacipirellulaceae bacterium]